MTRTIALLALALFAACSHAPGYPDRSTCRERCYTQHPSGPGLIPGADPWSRCVSTCCGARVRAPGESGGAP